MYISSFAPVKLFKLPRVEMELNSLFLVCVVHLLPVLTSHTLQTHWNASPAIHPDRRGQKHYTVKKKIIIKFFLKTPQNFQYTEGSTGLSIVEVKQWGFSHCRCFWLVPTGTRQILLTMALFNYRLISFSIGFFCRLACPRWSDSLWFKKKHFRRSQGRSSFKWSMTL